MNPSRKKVLGVLAAIGIPAAAIGGLSIGQAYAQTPTPVTADSSTTAASTDSTAPAPRDAITPPGPHSANGITEAVLTGDTAARVQAAVLAAQPGATIERMETDAEGATYEAHVKLADDSDATVKLDANFAVTGTVEGHG
jgi:hypothetical protein